MRTLQTLPRLLRRLAADRSGASAVELAVATPVLAVMIMATFDVSRGFSARLNLTEAASRAAELATAYGTVRTDYSTLRSEAVAAATASGVGTPAATVDTWLECDGVRQPSSTTMCQAGAAYARYVAVNVTGTYTPVFNVGGMIAGTGFPIRGAATVRIQ
jgi:Flp pilus assembly protein TadG